MCSASATSQLLTSSLTESHKPWRKNRTMENATSIALFCAGTALVLVKAYLDRTATTGSTRFTGKPSKEHKEMVASFITEHPDFPKKGVLFRDIFPIMRDPVACEALVQLLFDRIQAHGKIDVIVGLESRGFLFGPILALLCNCSFVPVRKPGKLPGKVTSLSFEKEYGKDTFEIQAGSIKQGDRVILFDDLLATGGSLYAGCKLVEALGGNVVECMVIIELSDLQGKKNVPAPVWSLYQY